MRLPVVCFATASEGVLTDEVDFYQLGFFVQFSGFD
jgi:hypothetical protein